MTKNRLANLGAIFADETRSEILALLMDGRAHTGGELARHIGVSPSTVSEHLSRLLDAAMVVVEPQGRHRYFRLASPEVAELLEALGAAPQPADLPGPKAPAALLYARTCYDHLAGELAVGIYDQLLADSHIEPDEGTLRLTSSGEALIERLGVDIAKARASQRPTVKSCLDWTERRHHLAGSVGAGILDALLDRSWIARDSKPRTIRVTDNGRGAIRDHFNLAVAP